jgi:uncharacterized RDD family membrane protein YckC
MARTMTAGDPTRVTGRRVVGYIFDSIIDVLVLLTFTALLGINLARFSSVGIRRPFDDAEIQKLVVAYGLYALYYLSSRVITLGFFGWTPGMLITGVRCVRWDGRPCGPVRAFVRTLVMGLGSQLFSLIFSIFGGAIFLLVSWLIMTTSKGHKNPGDFAAGTYVIDSAYRGRLIIETLDGLMTGPPSVTRDEAAKYLQAQGAEPAAPGTFVAPRTASAKNGEPFHDKALDTYVVWNSKEGAWLAFDKANGSWNRVG